jgi:DNA-binding CsgD family transcriptional regulator
LRPNRIWMLTSQAELAFEAGDWDQADAILRSIPGRPAGNSLVNLDLRRAALALGRGEDELARERLDEAARVGAGMHEPQLTSVLGALRAELARREGDLAVARSAVQEALDCVSDDAVRLALVSAVGAAVEADGAQRARDVGDAGAERAAVAQADAHVARARSAAENERPVETAWSLVAVAELTRADGAADAAAYAAAADAWTALERPEPAAIMRLREAEAYVGVGDRAAAGAVAREALAAATRLGAGWLRGEVEGLCARARLRLAPGAAVPQAAEAPAPTEEPFGLTRRERQVLVLLARGATNREIGAELFMAEKTASVHVSRILAKLDVRSRTEAAGVAHRLGLAA